MKNEYFVKTSIKHPRKGTQPAQDSQHPAFKVAESSKDKCLARAQLKLLLQGYYVKTKVFAVDHTLPPSKSVYIHLTVLDHTLSEPYKDAIANRIKHFKSVLGEK